MSRVNRKLQPFDTVLFTGLVSIFVSFGLTRGCAKCKIAVDTKCISCVSLNRELFMSPQVKPTVQALVIADHIYTDAGTNKKIVAGIFHTVFATIIENTTEKPQIIQASISRGGFQMGSPFAYLSLVNVRGEQPFVLRYVDLATDDVRFQVDLQINCRDPLTPVEVSLPLPPLPTDKYGSFALELLWKNEPLGAYRVHVKPLPLPPQKHGTPDDSSTDET